MSPEFFTHLMQSKLESDPVCQVYATLSHTKGAVHSISFSENGYYMASTADDGVKLWDLRKLHSLKNFTPSGTTNFASFDHSGNYLAVGGSALEVYGLKQGWQVVKTFTDLPKKVSFFFSRPQPSSPPLLEPHMNPCSPCCVSCPTETP